MKKTAKILSVLLLVVLLCAALALTLSADDGGSLAFKEKADGTYEVSGIGTYEGTEVEIPATYNGKEVTSIGYKAFAYNTQITSVYIPYTVKEIGDRAFFRCESLEFLDISSGGVENIGLRAFNYCYSLMSVQIPESVQTIEPYAFAYCEGLNTVDLFAKDTQSYAFYGCAALDRVYFGEAVETVGSYAFNACPSIKYVLYSWLGRSNITFDKGNDNIAKCTKHNFEPTNCTKCGIDISAADLKFVSNKDGTCYIAKGSKAYGNLIIPPFSPAGDEVVAIADAAFYENTEITSVRIPRTVASIGNKAFAYNTSLMNVDIEPGSENGVTIGDRAFFRCESLNMVSGHGIVAIGTRAFNYCYALNVIDIGNVETIMPYTFAYCEGLNTVDLFAKDIQSYAFYGCNMLTNVNFNGNEIKTIGSYAFGACPSIINVNYYAMSESGVKEISVAAGNKALLDADNVYYAYSDITVSFDSNGGSAVDAQTVPFGGTATLPTAPTKDGFIFAGWYLDGAEFDFSKAITSSITLTAKWNADLSPIAGTWTGDELVYTMINSYEIVIKADGTVTGSYSSSYGSFDMTINSVVYDGATLTINYTTSTTTADMVFVVSEDKTSMTTESAVAGNALTISKTYTVTFNYGEYDKADATVTVTHGDTVAKKTQTWTGHNLDAWLLDGEAFDFSTPITSDITLVAKWSVKVSKVTFLDQNGNEIKEIEVEYNQYVSEEDLPTTGIITESGYTFNGKWYTSSTSTSPVKFETAKITSDKTYYPGIIIPMNDIAGTWNGTDSKGNVYKMVVDAENADIDLTITSSADVADNVTIEVILYRTEAKLVIRYFAQGKTTATTLTLNYQANGTFTGSNSLVLEKEGAVSYTVAFDSNGGSDVAAQTIAGGGVAIEPTAPTKDGAIFAGWLLDGAVYDFATEVTGDITLTASWTDAYTVTFDKGSSQTEVLVAAGATVAKPTDPSKSNYTFLYWAIDGEEFDFETPITEDITLTAVFKGKDVTLAFYNQNKDLVENVIVEYGTIIDESIIPEAIMNDGFIFTGVWHKSYTATAAPFDLTAPITPTTTTQKLYPGFMAEEAYMMEGTWTGSTDTETYTFNISFEDGKPVITVSVETADGVTEYVVASMQYEATGVSQLKYFKEGSTTASTFKLTYDADSDTLTFNTKSISLERA